MSKGPNDQVLGYRVVVLSTVRELVDTYSMTIGCVRSRSLLGSSLRGGGVLRTRGDLIVGVLKIGQIAGTPISFRAAADHPMAQGLVMTRLLQEPDSAHALET